MGEWLWQVESGFGFYLAIGQNRNEINDLLRALIKTRTLDKHGRQIKALGHGACATPRPNAPCNVSQALLHMGHRPRFAPFTGVLIRPFSH